MSISLFETSLSSFPQCTTTTKQTQGPASFRQRQRQMVNTLFDEEVTPDFRMLSGAVH